MRQFRYLTTSIEGLVQQISCCYLRPQSGMYYYVSGYIPEGKSAEDLDQKLIEKYQINISKREYSRRKKAGLANTKYLRLDRRFFVFASEPYGKHLLFHQERGQIRDIRRHALRIGAYQVSYHPNCHDNKGHSHVRITDREYRKLEEYFLRIATEKSVSWLHNRFFTLPYRAYAPIRRQHFALLRAVNRLRKKHKLKSVPNTCVRLKRITARPFDPMEVSNEDKLKDFPWRTAA